MLMTAAVCAQTLESIEVRQPRVVGGTTTQAVITLDRPAPIESFWVELSSDGPVHVPMAVRIPAGERSALVTVLTDPTHNDVEIVIRGTVRGEGPRLTNLQILAERASAR